MSSTNSDQNINNNPEQERGQTDAEKCDIRESQDQNLVSGMVKQENIKNLSTDGCSGEKPVDNNLNAPPVVEGIEQEVKTVDCDTSNSTAIENITNILKEENSKRCDMKRARGSRTSAERIIRDSLIHKVYELDISGRFNKNTQNNKASVILKKETDSLKNLLVYENSSDDDDDFEKNWQLLTVPDSFSDSESDSNESIESSTDNDDNDDVTSEVIFGQNKGAIKKDTSKAGSVIKNSAPLDTPEVPTADMSKLNINYEKEEFLHIGHIVAIIDTLVTIEAIPGTPAYDLESYLFIEDKTTKKPLGTIFDVIGPVTAPIYCIRFSTTKDIQDLNIKHGLKVFSAPKSQYTHYVFVKELMKVKGTDASWIGDNELPAEVAADLSDDEDGHNQVEQGMRKPQKRKHGSLERHRQFEKSMNQCNMLNTRVAQLVDAHRHTSRPIRYNDHQPRSLMHEFQAFATRLPFHFDPSVPPPGFHEYFRESNVPQVRPPGRWSWLSNEMAQRPQVAQPNLSSLTQGQTNSANYFTNNAGRNHSAGPSSQPY